MSEMRVCPDCGREASMQVSENGDTHCYWCGTSRHTVRNTRPEYLRMEEQNVQGCYGCDHIVPTLHFFRCALKKEETEHCLDHHYCYHRNCKLRKQEEVNLFTELFLPPKEAEPLEMEVSERSVFRRFLGGSDVVNQNDEEYLPTSQRLDWPRR